MKILFLCGSLALGRDGVGDYTRRLAGEFIRQGQNAAIIALNDKHIDVLENASQVTDGSVIPVLRLPAALKCKERYAKAKLYIDEFDPEWLSLQYVPFSFQNKGLPWGLGRELSLIGKGRKWHVMFHELWVGMNVEAPIKIKLWGNLQRFVLRNTLRQLQPLVIHTQTKVYQFQLTKLGYVTHFLPLFGNITAVQTKNEKNTNVKQSFSFVIFGTIHDGAPVKEFARSVKEYTKTNDIVSELIFVGRCGVEQAKWSEAWNEQGLSYKVLGEQTPEKISEILHSSDCGITTTPFLLSEKSGSVAAMLEHGLPIVCVAKQWTIEEITSENFESEFWCFDSKNEFSNLMLEKRITNINTVSIVTEQFTNTLNILKD